MSINPFRAVTIAVDGTAEAVQWDATRGSLTHLQQAVDGLVDLVALHEHVTMWVNDEGIARGMPMNIVATSIARGFGLTHQSYFPPPRPFPEPPHAGCHGGCGCFLQVEGCCWFGLAHKGVRSLMRMGCRAGGARMWG